MKTFLRVFWRNMRHNRGLLFALAPVTVVLSALWVMEPLYARYAIDELLKVADGEEIPFVRLFLVWIGIYLLINVVQGLNMYLRWTIENRLLANTRENYYSHILRLDINHHVRSKTGELMKTVDNAADNVIELSRQILMELPSAILTSIIFYIVSFTVSWKLSLVALSLIPVYLLIVSLTVWWTKKNFEKVNKLWVRSIGRGYDALANIFTVKSSGAEEREIQKMAELHEEGIRELKRANKVWAILEGIGYFMLMRILLIGFGIYLLARGELSLGSLFFFQFSFFRLVIPMEMLAHMLPRWTEMTDKIKLAEQFYQTDIAIRNSDSPLIPADLKGRIEFRNVSFAYGKEETVKNLTLSVESGEHIALVGHSGAGKSTIALLLNRFYDVTDGTILVDGIDLKELDIHWWRRSIGLVLQENIMFNDSLLENIRYSRPEATMEEVIDAATRASAQEFIESFPDGYSTMIGERGIRLSGGERQRVAIARAILKKPSIVILDEATSALDSMTERQVQKGIQELIHGRTSFIIAHRLSTVRSVDRIAVLDKGRIIACAPHQELLKTTPLYREMVELQHEGMLAE